jgi:hypothetical protein
LDKIAFVASDLYALETIPFNETINENMTSTKPRFGLGVVDFYGDNITYIDDEIDLV